MCSRPTLSHRTACAAQPPRSGRLPGFAKTRRAFPPDRHTDWRHRSIAAFSQSPPTAASRAPAENPPAAADGSACGLRFRFVASRTRRTRHELSFREQAPPTRTGTRPSPIESWFAAYAASRHKELTGQANIRAEHFRRQKMSWIARSPALRRGAGIAASPPWS